MHFKKYQTRICFLLIISLLLCGMCFENIQTDSSFVCNASDTNSYASNTSSTLRSLSKAFPSEQVYSPETLGQREIAAGIRQSAQKSIIRMGRGSYYALWAAIILLQSFLRILTNHSCQAMHTVRSNAIILGYIHHKDGKKSNFLI